MVEQGPQALIAAVVRGEAPDDLLTQLQDTLETIHLQFAGALADFDGDTAPFAAARPLLEECLATVVATDRGGRGAGGAAWLPWALAGAARCAGRSAGSRCGRGCAGTSAVARLRSEPGIVLTEAERERRPLALRRAARPARAGSRGAARRPRGGHRATSSSAGSPTSRSAPNWCWPGRGEPLRRRPA